MYNTLANPHIVKVQHLIWLCLEYLTQMSYQSFIGDNIIPCKEHCTGSDHFFIKCNFKINVTKSNVSPSQDTTSFRSIANIDIVSFKSDLPNSNFCNPDAFQSIDEAASLYDKTLSQLLDKHAPEKNHTC